MYILIIFSLVKGEFYNKKLTFIFSSFLCFLI